jgi:hypothetical protein
MTTTRSRIPRRPRRLGRVAFAKLGHRGWLAFRPAAAVRHGADDDLVDGWARPLPHGSIRCFHDAQQIVARSENVRRTDGRLRQELRAAQTVLRPVVDVPLGAIRPLERLDSDVEAREKHLPTGGKLALQSSSEFAKSLPLCSTETVPQKRLTETGGPELAVQLLGLHRTPESPRTH